MAASHTVVVTGGSAGIGAAICRRFLDAGYEVISLSRRKPDVSHARLSFIEVDLTDVDETERAAKQIAQRAAVSHFVHNAGIIRPNLLEAVAPVDLEVLNRLHLVAPLVLLREFLPGMKSKRFGRVILISSRAALGVVTRTAYSATKAGMIGMSRTWALELAPFGITVNVVAPGPVGSTEMFHELVPAGSEKEAAIARAIPVGRLGTPEDVTNSVLFFSDQESGFVTGQVLYVCGGASVGTLPL